MLYDYTGEMIKKYPELYGDGVHDDSEALQNIVDTYDSVILPSGLTFKITEPITIDISKCRLFDGGNSTIIATGDITAIVIDGSMTTTMSANPNTLNSTIINDEGSFIFRNCKIMNANSQHGTGVALDGCFKTNINNCYIHNVKTGIAIQNQCRDIKITGNHIYACWLYGIHVQDTCNLHQCNIENNIINYAYYCVYFDHPVQIANFQIVGNDIEVSSYPTVQDKTGFRCIYIESGDGLDGQLSEFEIVGNTIQGHTGSTSIIEITGGSARFVKQITMTGNHISNCSGNMIVLTRVSDTVFSGNSFANAGGYVFSLLTYVNALSFIGNQCNAAGRTNGGFLSQTGEARKVVIEGNNSITTLANPLTMTGLVVSDTIISNNVIAGENTSVTVQPTQGARVLVIGNICASGTYTTNSIVTANGNI